MEYKPKKALKLLYYQLVGVFESAKPRFPLNLVLDLHNKGTVDFERRNLGFETRCPWLPGMDISYLKPLVW